MSCRGARATHCAVGIGLMMWGGTAWAEEGPNAGETRAAPGAADGAADGAAGAPKRRESIRMDLGVGLMNGLGVGSGASGLGGLGPRPSVAVEVPLSGPAWLVIGGSAGYAQGDDGVAVTARSVNAALRVGPRFEWHVIDRFDAGFHVQARVGVAHDEVSDVDEWDSYEVGGVAGASIHFRVSPVFGVRVATDLVEGGYASSSSGSIAGPITSGYARLSPTPSVEVTFTF